MNNFIDIKKLYFRILRLTRQLSIVELERDEWRKRYEQTLAMAVQQWADHYERSK